MQQLRQEYKQGQEEQYRVCAKSEHDHRVIRNLLNEAFVVVGCFAYLRRDPDALYMVWIDRLNNPPAGMT